MKLRHARTPWVESRVFDIGNWFIPRKYLDNFFCNWNIILKIIYFFFHCALQEWVKEISNIICLTDFKNQDFMGLLCFKLNLLFFIKWCQRPPGILAWVCVTYSICIRIPIRTIIYISHTNKYHYSVYISQTAI